MNNRRKISVIGGDSRQLFAAEYLKQAGFEVGIFGCEHANLPNTVHAHQNLKSAMQYKNILLPLPTSKDGKFINTPLSSREILIKDLLPYLSDNHNVFVGMGQDGIIKQLGTETNYIYDYFNIEDFTYKNALLTAEGILGIMLDTLPITVFGLKVAVFGYGRIGRFISDKLKKLGADVTVFARNDIQLTKAFTESLTTVKLNKESLQLNDYDCVINTVPASVINAEALKTVNRDCVLIEAASAPYGIDFDACEKQGKKLIKAFSLPGKTSPKSAGIIIGETVEKLLSGGERIGKS